MRPALLLAALLAPTLARADDPPRPRNVVTWQPASLAAGVVDVEYERVLAPRWSVYAAPGAIFQRERFLDGSSSAGVFGVSVDAGARFYGNGDAPAGWFLDVSPGVASSAYRRSGERVHGLGLRAAALFGWSFVFARHAALSLGLGVRVVRVRAGADDAQTYLEPAARLALGVAF